MNKWSINNISNKMESEVRLTPDDMVDAFLSENGIYAGNPILEFIDIDGIKRRLLSEMDADVPQKFQERPAIVRTATAEPSAIYDFRDVNFSEQNKGVIDFEFIIKTPTFNIGNRNEIQAIKSKMNTKITQLMNMAADKACELYRFPKTIQSKQFFLKVFRLGVANQEGQFILIPPNADLETIVGELKPDGNYNYKLRVDSKVDPRLLSRFNEIELHNLAQEKAVQSAKENLNKPAGAQNENNDRRSIPGKPPEPPS